MMPKDEIAIPNTSQTMAIAPAANANPGFLAWNRNTAPAMSTPTDTSSRTPIAITSISIVALLGRFDDPDGLYPELTSARARFRGDLESLPILGPRLRRLWWLTIVELVLGLGGVFFFYWTVARAGAMGAGIDVLGNRKLTHRSEIG